MKSIEAAKAFHRMYDKGAYLYTLSDVGVVLDETGRKLRATVDRLVTDGVLERLARSARTSVVCRQHPPPC